MELLKKENWLSNLLLSLLAPGVYYIILVSIMGLTKKDAWYTKWQYWVLAAICLIFPVFIFALVFMAQMLVECSKALDIPGSELYCSPYTWIICLVVPVIGWSLLMIMVIYLELWIIIMLYRGNGEKYIK